MKKDCNKILKVLAGIATAGITGIVTVVAVSRCRKQNRRKRSGNLDFLDDLELLTACDGNTVSYISKEELIAAAENGYDIWVDEPDIHNSELLYCHRVTPYVEALHDGPYILKHIDRNDYVINVMKEFTCEKDTDI